MSPVSALKWMIRNTVSSRDSLTPELAFRLITETCPMWMATPESCPMPDPYWAFYWPGGQAITRYILDNPGRFEGRRVIDVGCGCGAATAAALRVGVSRVLSNDIDHNALLATRLNLRLNALSPYPRVVFSSLDLIRSDERVVTRLLQDDLYSVVLLGDLFYDSQFALALLQWLQLVKSCGVSLLIGDPGRHALADCHLPTRVLAEYPLPGYVTREHYGFTTARVYEI